MISGAAVAIKFSYPPSAGLRLALEIALLLLALQPAIIVGRFSAVSNDTRQFRWEVILFFLTALLLSGFLVAGALVLLITDRMLLKTAALLAFWGAAMAIWLGYKLLYNSGRIDLLSKPN
jgi:hypothetical protein